MNVQENNCSKITYITEENAKENIKLFTTVRSSNKNRKRGKLTCYFCDKCNGWHLTSINKGIQRKISKKYKLRDERLK